MPRPEKDESADVDAAYSGTSMAMANFPLTASKNGGNATGDGGVDANCPHPTTHDEPPLSDTRGRLRRHSLSPQRMSRTAQTPDVVS